MALAPKDTRVFLVPATLAAAIAMMAAAAPYLGVVATILGAYLSPGFGGAGVALTLFDVAGVGAIIGLIVRKAADRDEVSRHTKLSQSALPLVALPVAMMASLPALIYQDAGLLTSVLPRIVRLWIPIGVFILARDCVPAGSRRRFMRLILGSGLILASFSVIAYLFQFPLPWVRVEQFIYGGATVRYPAQGFVGEASSLGNLLLLTVIVAYHGRAYVGRIMRMATLLSCAAAIVLTFNRASILGLVLFAVFVVLPSPRRWVPMAGLVLIGIWIVLKLPTVEAGLRFRIEQSIQTNADVVSAGRTSRWPEIVTASFQEPLFLPLGHGYKVLAFTDWAGHVGLSGDNEFVTALYETGLLGLAAVLLVLGTSWRRGTVARNRRDSLGRALTAWTPIEALIMMTVDAATYFRTLGVWFAVLGLVSTGLPEGSERSSDHPTPAVRIP